MSHKAEWTGHPIRLDLIPTGLLVKLSSHYTTPRDCQDDKNVKAMKSDKEEATGQIDG